MLSRLLVCKRLNQIWTLLILVESLSWNSYDINRRGMNPDLSEELCSTDTLKEIQCPVGTSPQFLYMVSEDERLICEGQMESNQIYCIEMNNNSSCQVGCVPDEDQCGSNGIQSITADGIICKDSNCIPGMQIGCVCLDDARGYQVCSEDGTRFDACVCD